MRIIRGTKNITDPIPYPVMAIGNFDGVHVGHQTLFRKAAELALAHEGTSIAFTFEPHPLKIIAPEKVPPMLTHFKKKMELIESFGINMVIVLTSPENLQTNNRAIFPKIFCLKR